MANPRQSAFVPFIAGLIRYHESVENTLGLLLTAALQRREPGVIQSLQREQTENNRLLILLRALSAPDLAEGGRREEGEDRADDEENQEPANEEHADEDTIVQITPPRNFTAVPGDNQVTLSWESPLQGEVNFYELGIVRMREPSNPENANEEYTMQIPSETLSITLRQEDNSVIENGAVFVFYIRAMGMSLGRDSNLVWTREITIGDQRVPLADPIHPRERAAAPMQELPAVQRFGYTLGGDFIQLAWDPVEHASGYFLQIAWTNGAGQPHYQEIITGTDVVYRRDTNPWVQIGANITFTIHALGEGTYTNGPQRIMNVVIRRGRSPRPDIPPHTADPTTTNGTPSRDLDFLIDRHLETPTLPPHQQDPLPHDPVIDREIVEGEDSLQEQIRVLTELERRLLALLTQHDPFEDLLRRLGPPARVLPQEATNEQVRALVRQSNDLLALARDDEMIRLLTDLLRRLDGLSNTFDILNASLHHPQRFLPLPIARALLPAHTADQDTHPPASRGGLQIQGATFEQLTAMSFHLREIMREIHDLRLVPNVAFRNDCNDYLAGFMHYRTQMETAIHRLQTLFEQAQTISQPTLFTTQIAAALRRIELLYGEETIRRKDTQKKMRQIEAQVLGPLAREMQGFRDELRRLIREAMPAYYQTH